MDTSAHLYVKLLRTGPVAWMEGTKIALEKRYSPSQDGCPVPLKPMVTGVTLLLSVQTAAILATRGGLLSALAVADWMPHCAMRPLHANQTPQQGTPCSV